MPSEAAAAYVPRHTIDDYRKAADECFKSFRFFYRWSDNFWRLGHSFDTAIDYFAMTHDSALAADFAKDVLNAFNDTKGHWYDDFGWWGLCADRAANRVDLFGYDNAMKFKAIRDKCWTFMDTGNEKSSSGDLKVTCCEAQDPEYGVVMAGAPNVYTQARKVPSGDPKQLYPGLAPRFGGGVWNCDWSYSAASGDVPGLKWAERCFCLPIFDEGNQKRQWAKDQLAGFQNTVTNALYLFLAARLDAKDQAKREYGFINDWIKASDRSSEYDGIVSGWTREDGRNISFVRERVPPTAAQKRDQDWAYRPKLAWAGDQGLLIAAFVQYLQLNRNDADLRNLLKFRSSALLYGTLYYIAEEQKKGTPGGRLRDWWDPTDREAPGADPGNYHTGSGVFWRCIQYVHELDTDFRQMIDAIQGFRDFLAFNADRACDASTARKLPAHVRDPNEVLTGVTNDLATLLAGIRILGP